MIEVEGVRDVRMQLRRQALDDIKTGGDSKSDGREQYAVRLIFRLHRKRHRSQFAIVRLSRWPKTLLLREGLNREKLHS